MLFYPNRHYVRMLVPQERHTDCNVPGLMTIWVKILGSVVLAQAAACVVCSPLQSRQTKQAVAPMHEKHSATIICSDCVFPPIGRQTELPSRLPSSFVLSCFAVSFGAFRHSCFLAG